MTPPVTKRPQAISGKKAGQGDDVAGAEAHQRLALAAHMGEDELAALALLPRAHGGGVGIDELGVQHVQGHEVEVVLLLALAGEVAEHVGDAIVGVARLEAPGLFQPVAEGGVVEAGLAAEEAEAEAQVARLQAGEVLGNHALQHGRVGRRAGDGGDAELADGVDEQPRFPHAERHHGGAGGLQRGVVGEAADPQAVVEAVDHAVAGTQAAGRSTSSTTSSPTAGGFGC